MERGLIFLREDLGVSQGLFFLDRNGADFGQVSLYSEGQRVKNRIKKKTVI